MSTPQAGILPDQKPAATFITLTLNPGLLGFAKQTQPTAPELAAATAARQACAGFPLQVEAMRREYPDSDIVGVLGVGSACWDALFPGARPRDLHPFVALEDSGRSAPSTPADFFVHIRSSRPDHNFILAQQILAAFGESVSLVEDISGFRYLDSRDLTGFVDGTENPEGDERPGVALVGADDLGFIGGSYVHIQRYVHDLAKWEALKIPEQEKVIGRTKQDDEEMDDATKPPTAHISRVVIEEDGEELEILRHSMPYGTTSSAGLYFVSYACSPAPFEKMLGMMMQKDGGGHYDHLMDFSRAVTGAAFFAPSLEFLFAIKP